MQEMGVVSANMELEVTVGLALTVQEVAEKLPLLDAFEDCIRRLDRHSPHIASMEHTLLCATVSREEREVRDSMLDFVVRMKEDFVRFTRTWEMLLGSRNALNRTSAAAHGSGEHDNDDDEEWEEVVPSPSSKRRRLE